MILEIFRNAGDNKPFAVFGGGAFDFEYMNETLIVTTQRATKQFECKHLNICQGYVAAYEEWESYRVLKVWSRKLVDYIFSSDDPERYDITPEKERVEVNRYYGEKDGHFVEITKGEYNERLKNRKE